MSIFQYISEHLDENGCFIGNVLPDNLFESVPKPLGTDDAAVYTLNVPDNVDDARILMKKFNAFLEEPLLPNRKDLHEALLGMNLAEYATPFLSAFFPEDMGENAMDMARDFFYNSPNREPVKFAILLFGLYGMGFIRYEFPTLWRDLLKVARCEEFTFTFLYSCRLTDYLPHNEVWELMQSTCGWGKVFAINNCHCRDYGERLWLLENGPRVDVEYPPLSVKLIKEIQLEKLLHLPLTFELYKNAVAIVGNYLMFLNNYSVKEISENYNLVSIDLYKLVQNLLEQAQKQITKAEDVLDIVSVSVSLRRLAEEGNLGQISWNQCQSLIATCDKLTYDVRWIKEIETRLVDDGKINVQLCDLAFGLEIDVWDKVYAYWLENLNETEVFPFLLSYDVHRSNLVLQQIESHLSLYASEQNALFVPLRYLQTHPGEGEGILCAALTSIYDLPRGIACAVLDNWDKNLFTPALYHALYQGLKLSTNPVVTARIEALLNNDDTNNKVNSSTNLEEL